MELNDQFLANLSQFFSLSKSSKYCNKIIVKERTYYPIPTEIGTPGWTNQNYCVSNRFFKHTPTALSRPHQKNAAPYQKLD